MEPSPALQTVLDRITEHLRYARVRRRRLSLRLPPATSTIAVVVWEVLPDRTFSR